MDYISSKNYKSGLWTFLLLFLVFLILNIAIGNYFPQYALYHEIIDVFLPCLIYLKVTKQPFASTLKLNKGLNFKSVIAIFQLFLASLLIKGGINYLIMLFGLVDPVGVTNQVIDMAPNLTTLFFTVSVLPVFFEEILMRGVVLDHFKGTSMLQASIMTGLLFGFIHVDLGQFSYSTALGILMAAIVISTGSLWGSILFHFLNNFLTVAFVGLMQVISDSISQNYMSTLNTEGQQLISNYSLWDKLQYGALAVGLLVAGTLLSIRYIKKLNRANSKERDISLEDNLYGQEGKDYGMEEIAEKPSWKELFVNVPFLLIVLIYIGINVVYA